MRLTLITALITLVVDQLTKLLVVHGLNLRARGEIDVFPPYLNFRMAWNEGINFGLLSRQDDLMKWILVAIALAISAAVLWWVHRERPRTAGMIAAGLLVGGAIGNVIEHVLLRDRESLCFQRRGYRDIPRRGGARPHSGRQKGRVTGVARCGRHWVQ